MGVKVEIDIQLCTSLQKTYILNKNKVLCHHGCQDKGKIHFPDVEKSFCVLKGTLAGLFMSFLSGQRWISWWTNFYLFFFSSLTYKNSERKRKRGKIKQKNKQRWVVRDIRLPEATRFYSNSLSKLQMQLLIFLFFILFHFFFVFFRAIEK